MVQRRHDDGGPETNALRQTGDLRREHQLGYAQAVAREVVLRQPGAAEAQLLGVLNLLGHLLVDLRRFPALRPGEVRVPHELHANPPRVREAIEICIGNPWWASRASTASKSCLLA